MAKLPVFACICTMPLLFGCAGVGPTSQPPPQASYVSEFTGQTRWIAGLSSLGVKVCDRVGNPLDSKCDFISNGKFVVGDASVYITGSPYYRADFSDGRIGYITEADLKYQTTTKDPALAAAECKKRGDPKIGMSSDRVIATCWGKPLHVNRTETGSVISDQYVYDGNRFVYLRNGIVESIQASGQLR